MSDAVLGQLIVAGTGLLSGSSSPAWDRLKEIARLDADARCLQRQ
jgi:hypothetical protein